jgi:hypothetical protein
VIDTSFDRGLTENPLLASRWLAYFPSPCR